jgi:hypothetical protein
VRKALNVPSLLVLFCVLVLMLPAAAQEKRTRLSPARLTAETETDPPQGEKSSGGESAKLPVKRVVLYKNGVGYFEHLGRVRGTQDLTIDFTSGQLNDVLKSLTVLDLGGGRITGVGYNSEAPLSKRLGGLRLPLGEQTTVSQFLGALRGARLEVSSGGASINGRLLSVERKTRTTKDGQVISYDEISLVSDAGEVRIIELSPAASVRIVEKDLNAEVGRYLGLVASTRLKDLRRMSISTAGTGERQIYVSYISEVPLWKTTYRMVLPSKHEAKPLLQGWAIVDNTVGEDWENVELSLVAGAPQSFIQQLSQPYYSRRPEVPLPEGVQLTPQTHGATLEPGKGRLTGTITDPSGAVIAGATVQAFDQNNQLVATATTDEEGNYEIKGLPDGNYRLEVQQQGFQKYAEMNVAVNGGEELSKDVQLQVGAVSQTVEVVSMAVAPSPPSAKMSRGVIGGLVGGAAGGRFRSESSIDAATLAAARAAEQAAAQARELGDLFEYKLKQPVTIRKNQSALVPILQSDIGAEKVSLWNQSQGTPRPLRALWLTNSSGLTLDGGSFSVLEDETFAGEGLMETIKPGEKRLLSYAADLGVRVETESDSQSQPVTRVTINRGLMIMHSELREKRTYKARNEDTTQRMLVIEHPRRSEYKLAEGLEPAETVAGFYRFRLPIESKKTATLIVNEVRPLQTQYAITNLNSDQIALFLRQKTISPEVEQALRRIVAQKNVIAGLDAQIQSRRDETKRIFDDQQRLRENMKALKGSPEEKALLLRYTKQLDDQETRLEALHKELAEVTQKRQQAQSELNKMIEELQLDSKL